MKDLKAQNEAVQSTVSNSDLKVDFPNDNAYLMRDKITDILRPILTKHEYERPIFDADTRQFQGTEKVIVYKKKYKFLNKQRGSCGSPVVQFIDLYGGKKLSFCGLSSCKSIWSCPSCRKQILAIRRDQIAYAFNQLLHVGGANGDTFSIALLGNFETLVPSFASIKTLEQVLAVKLRKFGYNKKSDTQRIVSHNDVAKIRRLGYGTACCGKNLYAKLPALRDSVSRYLI